MQTQATKRHYERLADVIRLVEGFEDGTLPHDEWNHEAHLTVALWYMLHYEEQRATAKTIGGIRAYNRRNGIRQTRTGGYHETITLFWLAITHRFLDRSASDQPDLELFNRFLDEYAGRDLIKEHYSADLIRSWRARLHWVEPDLRPIDPPEA